MRVISVFFWIIIGAALLWFFTLNLNQYVDINLYNKQFNDVNLVAVIFISLFLGVVIGALVLSTQIIGAKTEIGRLKKENKKLVKELEGLRNTSIDEIPDTDSNTDNESVS
ncbi:MAG: DUF1049 domain-containing protein [Caldithrix sp.]|nr:DUF1049 domain-containing protein [Caldithrix sp.]